MAQGLSGRRDIAVRLLVPPSIEQSGDEVTDILEKLRRAHKMSVSDISRPSLFKEAADEITALREAAETSRRIENGLLDRVIALEASENRGTE